MVEKTDEEILFLSQKNSNLFSELIDRYELKLNRYIQRISNLTQEERDDLLQDIFISVYENIYAFEKGQKFSSWIYRIAHNKTINLWKKYQKNKIQISIDENQSFVDSKFWHNDVLKEITELDDAENLRNAILNLEMKYREVLIFRYWEEKTYEEISDILKLPKATVGTLINRGKKKLKEEYDKIIK